MFALSFVLCLCSVAGHSQAVLQIEQEPVCWLTPAGADSSLTRYVLFSSRTPTAPVVLAYVNATGTVVNPTGGSFSPGWCGCCGDGGGGDNDWYFINENAITAPVWRSGRVLIGTPDDLPADTAHQLQLEGDWQFLPDAFGSRFDWQDTADTTGTSWYGILFSAPAGLGGSSNLSGSRNTLTLATSNTVIDRTRLGVLAFAGNSPTDTDHALGAFMEAVAEGNWTSVNLGTSVNLWTTAPGEAFPRNTFTFQGDGRLELDRYFLFSDGVPTALLGYDSTTRDATRHPIAGTPAPGSAIVVDGSGTGLEFSTIDPGLKGLGIPSYVARWIVPDSLSTGVIQDNGSSVGINLAPSSSSRIFINDTNTATTGTKYSARSFLSQNATANSSSPLFSGHFQTVVPSSFTFNQTGVVTGLLGSAQLQHSSNVANVTGGFFEMLISGSSTASTSNGKAVDAIIKNNRSTSAITSGYGIYAICSGRIANAYGVYSAPEQVTSVSPSIFYGLYTTIAPASVGTTNYGVYQLGTNGTNYFQASTVIRSAGYAAPYGSFDVANTDAIGLASGSDAQRPPLPPAGKGGMRYSNTSGSAEVITSAGFARVVAHTDVNPISQDVPRHNGTNWVLNSAQSNVITLVGAWSNVAGLELTVRKQLDRITIQGVIRGENIPFPGLVNVTTTLPTDYRLTLGGFSAMCVDNGTLRPVLVQMITGTITVQSGDGAAINLNDDPSDALIFQNTYYKN